MNIIEKLKWRYATKKFNPTFKLSTEQVDQILQSINLTPTSFGLQPFRAIVIDSILIREALKKAANGQSQVTDAALVIVFAAQTKVTKNEIETYISNIATTRNIPIELLADYKTMITASVGSWSDKEQMNWAARQTYIALGQLLTTCALLELDACPMEGFEKTQFDAILGLEEKNLVSTVMITIGKRAVDDDYQHLTKVRKSIEDIIIRK